MGKYKVFLKPTAVREIEAIDGKKNRRLIIERIGGLSEDPRPPGSQKLSGEDKYRVRQGSYRMVYRVDDAERSVYVVKVGHRRDVYR